MLLMKKLAQLKRYTPKNEMSEYLKKNGEEGAHLLRTLIDNQQKI